MTSNIVVLYKQTTGVNILHRNAGNHQSNTGEHNKKPKVIKVPRNQSFPQISASLHQTTVGSDSDRVIRRTIHRNPPGHQSLRNSFNNETTAASFKNPLKIVNRSDLVEVKASHNPKASKPTTINDLRNQNLSFQPAKVLSTIPSISTCTIDSFNVDDITTISEVVQEPNKINNHNGNNPQLKNNIVPPKEYHAEHNPNEIIKNNKPTEALQNQNTIKHPPFQCTKTRILLIGFGAGIVLILLGALIAGLVSISFKTTTTTTHTTVATTQTTQTTTTTTSTSTSVVGCNSSCISQSWTYSSGIIASWPYENSFQDSRRTYNSSTSSLPPTFVSGYVGEAASFNATKQNSIYTSFIPLNGVSFTIDVWIKRTDGLNETAYTIVGLCPSIAVDSCLYIGIRNDHFIFGFSSDDLSSTQTVPLNRWTHVAFVFSTTTLQQLIYINGILDQQRTATTSLQVTSGNFTIGIHQLVDGPNNYFEGYLDQLSINSRVRSSCEVLDLATLAAYFKFDVEALADSGPNGISSSFSNHLIVAGHDNQAISFFGTTSSYFQAGSFTSFGMMNQSFSIALWIQPQDVSGTLVHLSTSSSGTGSSCFPLLGFASNGTLVAQVLISNRTFAAIAGPLLSVPSTWIAIVQTWSQTNGLRLYVNKVLIATVPASTFLVNETATSYLTLGNCLNGCSSCLNGTIDAPGPFMGLVDDWRVYSRELDYNDICTLYSL